MSFTKVTTVNKMRLNDEAFEDFSSQVVPDLTGDGVPDYLVIETQQHMACEENRDSVSCRSGILLDAALKHLARGRGDTLVFLYRGKMEDGKLARSSTGTLLYSTTDPAAWWGLSWSVPSAITRPDVRDFNSDGVMDISFWVLTGKGSRYTQMLLLNNVDFAEAAVEKR